MIQCKHIAAGKCGGELCRVTHCPRYTPARDYGAYGWDVTVRFGPPRLCEETFHWRGCSAAAARRKGMLKSHAVEIIAVEPVSEEEWIRAYGDPEQKETLR